MCQATVILVDDGDEQEIMRDVVLLAPVAEGVRVQALFEEPVTLQARIGHIDFLKQSHPGEG